MVKASMEAGADAPVPVPDPALPQMPDDDPAVPKDTVGNAQDKSIYESDKSRMRKYLAEQPKVRYKVHSDGDVFVQMNGYGMIVKPGQEVYVPKPVADLLDEGGY